MSCHDLIRVALGPEDLSTSERMESARLSAISAELAAEWDWDAEPGPPPAPNPANDEVLSRLRLRD